MAASIKRFEVVIPIPLGRIKGTEKFSTFHTYNKNNNNNNKNYWIQALKVCNSMQSLYKLGPVGSCIRKDLPPQRQTPH